VLTVARALEAALITTPLSLVRLAFASSLLLGLLIKGLIHYKTSSAVQRTLLRCERSLTLLQFLLALITINAILVLT
jgi:hypothetical protein